jgi:hypothetical protein
MPAVFFEMLLETLRHALISSSGDVFHKRFLDIISAALLWTLCRELCAGMQIQKTLPGII